MARLPVVGADRDNWGGILNEYLGIEHGDGGYHNISFGNTASRPASPEEAQIYINTQTYHFEQYRSAAWTQVASLIPSGTKMIFYQGSAPTGWTKDTTDNDKALRVVSGTGGVTAGTNSFSTILTSEVTVDIETSHTHAGPSHSHTLTTSGTNPSSDLGDYITHTGGFLTATIPDSSSLDRMQESTDNQGTGSTGGGTDHSHTKTFDIEYMDVVVCTKD